MIYLLLKTKLFVFIFEYIYFEYKKAHTLLYICNYKAKLKAIRL